MSVLTPLGFSLLRQLADGAFHSGEDLAATVGLTRARVSQLLKQAETAGLSLERVRGLGYRLTATPDFLDADEVRRALREIAAQGRRVPAAGRRGGRPDRLDVDRALAPRAAPRHPRRRAGRRMAKRRPRAPRQGLDRRRRRQPDVLAGLALRAGCRVSGRAVAGRRRRGGPGARSRRACRASSSSGRTTSSIAI